MDLAVAICKRFAEAGGASPAGTSLEDLKAIASLFPAGKENDVNHWVNFSRDVLGSDDGRKVASAFSELDSHLAMRSYMVGYAPTAADFAVWAGLKASPVFQKTLKMNKAGLEELQRWYNFVGSMECVTSALEAAPVQAKGGPQNKAAAAAKAATTSKEAAKKDANAKESQSWESGDYSIDVPDAVDGQVVTRFAPEPSGYLHIGHAKAVLVSHYIAKRYHGKFYVRFDDTNPSKEKMEFEESIKEDLLLMGVVADKTTHTSDYFDHLYEKALDLIERGLAYADDTDMETMRYERGEGIKSKCRDQSIEETKRRFEEMRQGTPFGLTCALRAKISVDDPNKAMRDPVIYRCNVADPHHITGTKWKVYPTYDFAAPVVDSLEGITHALRANEYRDRNPQYNWFFKALEIRPVHIFDYSKVNFIYTLLSKRKLKWFVEEGHVSGWDDPRFATIRGIRRRGMTIEALRSYILSQGASQSNVALEWDKIWSTNKKVIDPIAPRFTALVKKDLVPVDVVGETFTPYTKEAPKHKKNPDVGVKKVTYSPKFWLEQVDAKDSQPGEEVTLMDWGNVIFDEVARAADGTVQHMTAKLNLDGDFKKTKRKLTWISELSAADVDVAPPAVELVDYDYLITKKKIEEDEEVQNFLTPVTEFVVEAIGDRNLVQLAHGEIIQFERKGYYICDRSYDAAAPSKPIRMIAIPDGSDKTTASKSAASAPAAKPAAPAAKASKTAGEAGKGAAAPSAKADSAKATPASTSMFASKVGAMYQLAPIMPDIGIPPAQISMYKMRSIYGNDMEASVPSASSTVAGSETNGDVISPPAPAKAEAASAGANGSSADTSLFAKLDIRIGRVVDVKKHPDADSLYVETIDVGEAAPRTVVSGLVKFLQPSDLQDKLVVLLTNLKPAAMRGIKSAAMVLCASNADHTKVELLIPPEGSVPGDRVTVEGQQGEPEEQLNPKKKVFETVQPDITTTSDLLVVWQKMPLMVAGKGVIKTSSIPAAVVK